VSENKVVRREQLTQLRLALNLLSQPAWIAGADRVLDFCNQSWYSYVGNGENLQEHSWETVLDPSVYPEFESRWQAAVRNMVAFEMDVLLRSVAGTYRWFALGVNPIISDDGTLDGWVGINTGIHELKQRSEFFVTQVENAEQEARKSEDLFREMARSIEEIFWVTDARGTLPVYVSPAFEKIYGRTVESLKENPKSFLEATHPDDRAKLTDHIKHQREERVPWELEFRICRPDGEVRWLWARSFSIFDDKGTLIRLCGITSDITERKIAEQRVSEFYSTVSHELRTPLTSIRGALGLLDGGKGGDLSALGKQLVSVGREECERLVRLVNDFLDMRKIEANRVELKLQKTGSEQLVKAVIDAVKPFASERHVDLVFVASCNERVLADRDKMVQVLTNLVSNAVKFSPPQSRVEIRTVKENSFVRFSVKDYGPGISQANQKKLFQLFQQISQSDTGSGEGTGLGLAICKALTERMGGKIGVQSEEGKGALFFCDIPLAPRDAHDCGPKGLSGGSLSSVLLVEDDDALASVIFTQLQGIGLSVQRAFTLKDARQAISSASEATNLAAVILDVQLPDGNGLNLMEAISQSGLSLPVVVVSAQQTPEGYSDPLLIDWISKPYEEQRLVNSVRYAVSRQRGGEGLVLIIEDDESTRAVLKQQIGGLGVETFEVTTGEEGILEARARKPGLIILDLCLPGVNGFDVVKVLRQDPDLRNTPLLVYTAKDLDEDDKERLQLGLTAHLTKSKISEEEFLKNVVNLLDGLIKPSTR
jgi:PAS domain S-box-containing protein